MADRQSGERPTKTKRREQARRERQELQRKVERGRRRRRIVLSLVVLVAVGATAFAVTRPKPVSATPGELFRAAADAKIAAGCGAVEDVGPYQPETQDQSHISDASQMPPLSTYPSVPPASGPHNDTPLGAGVYTTPPPIDRVIHSLEHGAVVIWHTPDLSGEELDRLRTFYRKPTVGSRVIVAPYDYPDAGQAGRLQAGTQMALVAWHHVQSCAELDLAAAFDFSAKFAAPPFGLRPYLGDAPEPGAAI